LGGAGIERGDWDGDLALVDAFFFSSILGIVGREARGEERKLERTRDQNVFLSFCSIDFERLREGTTRGDVFSILSVVCESV